MINLVRREGGMANLEFFLTTYFPRTFSRPFSADHKIVIRQIQDVIVHGGKQASGLPRGAGSTSLIIGGAIWATITGRRQFPAIITESGADAASVMDGVSHQLLYNSSLQIDFPECYRHTGRMPCRGMPDVMIDWNPALWVGGPIECYSITGRFRGVATCRSDQLLRINSVVHPRNRVAMYIDRPLDEPRIRPDLTLCDGLQSVDSAESLPECARREKILLSNVQSLGGPTFDMPCLYLGATQHVNDLADRMLNRKFHPGWNGKRFKLLYVAPVNLGLWAAYAGMRLNFMLQHLNTASARANEFYRANRAEMDAGAVVAWPERFNPDQEFSGIQHAMNLLIDSGPARFWAEYQNEPNGEFLNLSTYLR